MKLYEGLFILPPDSTPDAKEKNYKTLEQLIQKFKGSVKARDDWGKRSIGYTLKKNREGQFLVLDVELPQENVAELRRNFERQAEVLKYTLFVKKAPVVRKEKKDRGKAKTAAAADPKSKPAAEAAAAS